MKPKIEVGTYQTRDGRVATVMLIDKQAVGMVGGVELEWRLDGKYYDDKESGLDLAARINKPEKRERVSMHPESEAKPSTLEVRATKWTIAPQGKPIFDELAMTLTIEDEAGGEFLVLKNCGDCGGGSFRFNAEDWPTLRALIDEAVGKVRQ